MHLAYKNMTPERLQACFHALAMNDIRGPNIGIPVPPVHIIPIEAPVLHGIAVDRLNNYDSTTKKNLQLLHDDGMVWEDGMYIYDRLQSNDSSRNDRGNVACEQIFDIGISNSTIPDGAIAGHSARSILRSVNDTSFGLADRLGEVGRMKLEQMHREFHAWAVKLLQRMRENKKRMMRRSRRILCVRMLLGMCQSHKRYMKDLKDATTQRRITIVVSFHIIYYNICGDDKCYIWTHMCYYRMSHV